MLTPARLARALKSLKRVTIHGPWTRVVPFHLLLGPPPGSPRTDPPQPLWGGGAMLHGARFTPKGSFSSIYLASDPITALMEIVSVFDHPNWARSSPPRAVPWTLFTVDGVVANLIDLADAETQELLGTNDQELSGIFQEVQAEASQ